MLPVHLFQVTEVPAAERVSQDLASSLTTGEAEDEDLADFLEVEAALGAAAFMTLAMSG